jgi:hypothetical protein
MYTILVHELGGGVESGVRVAGHKYGVHVVPSANSTRRFLR